MDLRRPVQEETKSPTKTVLTNPIISSVSAQGDKPHLWLVIASVVTKDTEFGTVEGSSSGDAGMIKIYPNLENMPKVGDTLKGSYQLGDHYEDEKVARFRKVLPV